MEIFQIHPKDGETRIDRTMATIVPSAAGKNSDRRCGSSKLRVGMMYSRSRPSRIKSGM
ncbi:unnamed protein product [Periconia digitata]|uniref:Uncharacterized protein n=1 Tax=Periconia digitata TaxID=1303443 RepID=A0A9W4UDA9_9PLEO|nr:unnamed protein product [Periconia digitata]